MKRDVVATHFKNFQEAMRTTKEKLEGVLQLTVSNELKNIELSESVDRSLLPLIEKMCITWLSQLQDSLSALDEKYFVGSSPLNELEYWKDRYTNLDLLSKQLKNPTVAYIINVQNKINGLMTPTVERLESLLIEAKENNRFLSTCERHFKNIEMGANYQIVIESIVPLMKSLRLIWMISRHYNNDERMISLMEKIAKVLIDRVKKVNSFQTLFMEGLDVVKSRTSNAETLLKLWKQAYLETRHFIETSGRGTRWEFDRKRLFQQTDYMAAISHDINAAVHIIDEFNQLYELNLFTVTIKPSKIAEMKQTMASLQNSFQTCKFDPFDSTNERAWVFKMESFSKELFEFEVTSQLYIQDAFRNIRSPVMGLQLFKNLNMVLERSSLTKMLNEKLKDISNSFFYQVNKTRQDFEDNFYNPPLFKSQPPVAGTINWQRFLFVRLKNTLISLLYDSDCLSIEEADKLKDTYLTLCKEMKQYSQKKYSEWYEKVDQEMEQLLKSPVLAFPYFTQLQKLEFSHRSTQNQFKVNFDPYIFEVIMEAKYLAGMGFNIPESVKTAVLLEQDFNERILLLKKFLNVFHEEISKVNEVDFMVLEDHIKELFRVVFSGMKRINWRSAGVSDFVERCHEQLEGFVSVMSQYKKNIKRIEDRLENIIDANYFSDKVNFKVGVVLDCKDYFDLVNADREEITERLIQDYNDITSMVQHVEFVIWKSSSGKCSRLKHFYLYYESRILQALTAMVMTNLNTFICLLSGQKSLFQIHGVLYHPYLELNPSNVNILRYISQCAADCIFTTKLFPRWLNASAIPVSLVKESSVYVYSFLNDIALNPDIINLLHKIQSIADNALTTAKNTLKPWKRFEVVWQSDKDLVVSEWIEQVLPKACNYDEVLWDLKNQLAEINSEVLLFDVDFLQMNLSALAYAVKEHYITLFDLYTNELHLSARNALVAFKTDCEKKLDEMSFKPTTIEDLKSVLQLLNEIFGTCVEKQLLAREITEKYNVLEIYGIVVGDEEKLLLNNLDMFSYILIEKARFYSSKLKVVKKKFAELALREADEFHQTLTEFVKRFYNSGPGIVDDLEVGLSLMREFNFEMYRLEQKRQDIGNSQKLFDLPIVMYSDFFRVQKDINYLESIYKIFKNYMSARSEWDVIQWTDLNVNSIQDGIDSLLLQAKKLPKAVKEMQSFTILENCMKSFKDNLPIIVELKNEAMRERHWKILMNKTKIKFDTNINAFTLKNLFAMNLANYYDVVIETISDAIKEANIEKALKEIEYTWSNLRFNIVKYHKNTLDKGHMIGSVDEINQLLDDQTMQLQGMNASRNVVPFLNSVQSWEKQLSLISEVIYSWVIAQRKWLYLDSIFLSGDIKVQLPEEARLFDKLDKAYMKIMKETALNPVVKICCLTPGRLREFEELILGLDRCQKSLNEYLDSKRNAFPRFYFISDDELLSIIGSTDPQSIQEHIIKIFDNVASIKLQPSTHGKTYDVMGMISAEGEQMPFKNKVVAEGKVEAWINNVLTAMQNSNRRITKEAIFYYCAEGRSRISWMMEYQGMVCLAGNQVWWTWEVEDVFQKAANGDKQAMKLYSKKLVQQIDDLVLLIRKPMTANNRKKINTVLMIDVHARDIIEGFVRDSILRSSDFQWESQLRFYWDIYSDQLIVHQCSGKFLYGYEYMGLNGRLVITPLTDRIYLTLTQALSMKLGGAPAGPAGTGKTETTKDLAKALGLLCVVTNCGEGMDYKAIGKIFAGLCQSGSWGCFDEFNRIEISVLSVISSQLQTIRNALLLTLTQFNFEGGIISLDHKVGIFITMNPGYAGRTELPESIKALFRPVVCIVPDLQMICEIMLFSEGFLMAKVLAKKMTVLYKLASEQLSRQYHYDFKLRAIKSVLVMAGELKRASDAEEDVVLMRALRDMNLPKFVFEDVPLFLGLIGDLFPGLNCPRIQYPELTEAIEDVLKENKYIVLAHQVDKVVQLQETMLTRHTTMVVGPTCGGKSVIINTLALAQTRMGVPTKLFTLNPKERSVVELYGVLDPVSRDWTDGLLSNVFREINKPTDKVEKKYIVFDGDVDALWVENMNSVMDDNKLLTLANGERIRLQKHCSMIFEVSDLQYAQPSTVSRCGMVYVDSKNLKYEPYWQKWLKEKFELRQNLIEMEVLNKLFIKYIPPCIDLIFEGKMGNVRKDPLKTIIPLTNLNLVRQLTHMLDALIEYEDIDFDVLECLFVEALYWSLGAGLLENSRAQFDTYVKQITTLYVTASDVAAGPGELPGDNTIYEFIWDHQSNQWIRWTSKVPDYIHDPNVKFNEILVPTIDTVSMKWILSLFLKMEKPILFSGESGTSKTATITSFLKNLNSEEYQVLGMNFSSRTTSLDCQKNIENHTEKRTRDVFGPPVGKRLVIFVDDLNMPQIDPYGTQQPIAMLKLLLGYSGIYDRGSALNWKTLRDLDWIAAMGNPGGGRNHVDPRFISLFSFAYMVFPTEDSIFKIYSSILSGYTTGFASEIRDSVEIVTHASMNLFTGVLKDLPPTPSKFHYIFSLRDLSRIYSGLSLMTAGNFKTRNDLFRVWRHECLRVFSDRLTNEVDQEIVVQKIRNLLEINASAYIDMLLADPIIYGDYINVENDDFPRSYKELESYESLKNLYNEIIDYSKNSSKISLVLFDDALEHLNRINRVLLLPKGHCLLMGLGNVGKFSLAKLAACIAGLEIFTIELARGYSEASFKEDLKILYDKICIQNLKVAFLFKDQYIVEENFLELINNMLTLGTVPSLFDDEETEKIMEAFQRDLPGYEKAPTKEIFWHNFAKRANTNLHIILSMAANNEELPKRCRNFPGLVSNTNIDWVFPWPSQALLAVATSFISDETNIIPVNHQTDVIQIAIYVHFSAIQASVNFWEKQRRRNYISPKNYLDFLATYIKLVKEQYSYINMQCDRLDGGIKKLLESAVQLNDFNAKLAVQKIAVNEKTQSCQKLLTRIAQATAEAEAKQSLALIKSAQIEEQTKDITREKEEAREALSKAMPALESAKQALDYIDRNDVTEIRSFAKPPKPVQTIGECIVVLKGIKDVSWKSAKTLMTDPNFLKSLKELDVDNIPIRNIHVVKYCLKEMNITVEEMRDKSRAGAGLMKFVQAVVGYCEVYKEVKPKKEKVERLEKEFATTMHELEKITSQLNQLQKTLDNLKHQYETAMLDKKQLEDETDLMQRRIVAADRLIKGLGSERIRWQKELEDLYLQKGNVIGDCLLCAGFLTYTSPFTWQFRENLVYNSWLQNIKELEIPLSEPFSLTKLLTNDVEISKWNSEGLPPDELSVQNAILATRSNRFPLCIDPQQQAMNWIKQREKGTSFKISSFNEPDYIKHLELAVKYGSSFLFQDVDDYVDPLVYNILSKTLIKQGAVQGVMMGDKMIDFDDNFRLYLNTKLPNPNYPASIYAFATVINFIVTFKGLEEQLLGVIVKIEKNELEERREQLIYETSTNKKLLKDLEDSLLRELAQSKGNMLDSVDLLTTLENTKLKSSEVAEKLRLGALTTDEIDRNRDIYRPVAKLGAILFFVLGDLATINVMYQYSLSAYIKVFEYSLRRSLPDSRIANRLKNISEALLINVYNYGCTGIFEKHKLLFSLQIAVKLKLDENSITEEELDFLTKGNVSLEKSPLVNPFAWLPDDAWECLTLLPEVSPNNFENIISDIQSSETDWKVWYDHDSPETLDFPMQYEETLSDFHRLMLLRCFRLDRLYCAISDFISDYMGEQFITPPIVSLSTIHEQSSTTTPVIFILSVGSDPTSDLIKFADSVNIKNTQLKILSLGQGQEKTAMSLITAAVTHGHWLILQNCHLLIRFMRDLEKEFENFTKPHPDFRLWLTTEPVGDFPISVLQRSLKVVTEPPNGLKHNLQSTYVKLVSPVIEKFCAHPHYPSLLFVLSFFHAVVQERRKYGKIGWNISYDFNDSDFIVCNTILQSSLQKVIDSSDEVIPWNSLKYLIGEVMYGGRAIDDFDRRILNTYMNEYMGDFLLDPYQKFHFNISEEFEYLLPTATSKEEYLEYIEDLPLITSPEVLGLHENAEISYFLQAGQDILDFMKMLQPKTKITDSSGSNREDIVSKLAQDMLSKIPEEFNIDNIRKNHANNITPSIIVLLQELESFNKLSRKMINSLHTLRKAIAGEVGMDNDLDEISNSLFFGVIPQLWRRLAPLTKKSLASWITFHLDRRRQYNEWAFDNEPVVMWLSGLHVPESYITALIQMTCRKNGWPLSKSTLFTKVMSEPIIGDALDSISQGKMVTGLYLEGAGWDYQNCCLVKQEHKKLSTPMPIIKMIPIQRSKLRLANTLRTPVYVTSDRRDAMGVGLIFEADLPTKQHLSHWILQGVCLVLNPE
ncbi:hypothetical protein HELRODRAFT_67881 [Helobdella robusta]|uniref:Dynein-1, subspecies f n=1 Tax=Helobdella robusta TaxID=6412 RepID=T1FZ69_HELRO|nr:hypothetical protein HELRODRAFT_67881 [Helobdella robusta]ESN96268.1 hypothetical protein HELRODRAFT_67881 [Helobdella robusta]